MRVFVPLLIALALAAPLAASDAKTPADKPLPSFDAIKQIVERELAKRPFYQPGDLLSRSDLEPIVDALQSQGWPIPTETFYDDVLPDSAPLVALLHSRSGRPFMRQVAGFPEVYDRLERMTWPYGGTKLLRQWMSDPEGVAHVKRLTTPEGIKQFERDFAQDDRSPNFGLPSGKIHTADELLAELKRVHAQLRRSQAATAE
jgi:hypothetical protein